MFNLGQSNPTKTVIKGFYENKKILEIEMDSVEQAELLISRMKTQKWTSIRSIITEEYARYFITQMDLEIDSALDEVRYFLKLNKYNG